MLFNYIESCQIVGFAPVCSEEELGRMDADGYNVVEGESSSGTYEGADHATGRLSTGAHHAWADYADCRGMSELPVLDANTWHSAPAIVDQRRETTRSHGIYTLARQQLQPDK